MFCFKLGGRVDGALGDVRNRSGKEHDDLNRWLLRQCSAASYDQPKKGGQTIPECVSDDDVSFYFCFVLSMNFYFKLG